MKKLTREQLLIKWKTARRLVSRYDSLLRKIETKEQALEREISTWPKWKRDIHICGSQIRIGDRTICSCFNPKEYQEIREKQRKDRNAYSYWPC